MKEQFFTPTVKEILVATTLIVVPLILGYFFKALEVETEYYLPTIVIAWAVLLINSRIENKKILNDIHEERKTYQSVLNQLSNRATENLRYLQLLTKYGATVKVGANQMVDLWREACETIQGKYAATNYIDPKVQFGPLGRAALSMQHAHHLYDRAKIQKIFIHDTHAEMKAWISNENERQEHTPFTELRHVIVKDLAQQLPNDFKHASEAESARARVREMDFALFNELFLLEWDLDAARQVTGGSLVWDKQKVEDRKTLFSRMWQVATDHNELSKTLRNAGSALGKR